MIPFILICVLLCLNNASLAMENSDQNFELHTVRVDQPASQEQHVHFSLPETEALVREIPSLKDYVRDRKLESVKTFRTKLLERDILDQKTVCLHLRSSLSTLSELDEHNQEVDDKIYQKHFKRLCAGGVTAIIGSIATMAAGEGLEQKNTFYGGVGALLASLGVTSYIGVTFALSNAHHVSQMDNEIYELKQLCQKHHSPQGIYHSSEVQE